jgi:hypothetical protein
MDISQAGLNTIVAPRLPGIIHPAFSEKLLGVLCSLTRKMQPVHPPNPDTSRIKNPEGIIMKSLVRLLCGVVLSSTIMSAAIAAEGKVVSTLDTDTYTYVEISQNDQNSWIVGPLVALQPGNQVHFEEGMIMHDFYSKQLNRTFPEVMFVDAITVSADHK